VMSASEPELGEDFIGIGREITVGEKQKLDDAQAPGVGMARIRFGIGGRVRGFGAFQFGVGCYVSHVDIY